MAIDGVKIIDSDDGYDIYNTVVDRYKKWRRCREDNRRCLNDEKNFCTDGF